MKRLLIAMSVLFFPVQAQAQSMTFRNGIPLGFALNEIAKCVGSPQVFYEAGAEKASQFKLEGPMDVVDCSNLDSSMKKLLPESYTWSATTKEILIKPRHQKNWKDTYIPEYPDPPSTPTPPPSRTVVPPPPNDPRLSEPSPLSWIEQQAAANYARHVSQVYGGYPTVYPTYGYGGYGYGYGYYDPIWFLRRARQFEVENQFGAFKISASRGIDLNSVDVYVDCHYRDLASKLNNFNNKADALSEGEHIITIVDKKSGAQFHLDPTVEPYGVTSSVGGANHFTIRVDQARFARSKDPSYYDSGPACKD